MNADGRDQVPLQPGWDEWSEIEHMHFKIHSGSSIHLDTPEHAAFSRSCGLRYPHTGKAGDDDIWDGIPES